jgi:transcriptional regulator with XRE-family HTH domain
LRNRCIQRAVANKIKALRKEKHISQDRLAELAKLDRAHLFRIESGTANPTLRTLKVIADALRVRVRDLIGEM